MLQVVQEIDALNILSGHSSLQNAHELVASPDHDSPAHNNEVGPNSDSPAHNNEVGPSSDSPTHNNEVNANSNSSTYNNEGNGNSDSPVHESSPTHDDPTQKASPIYNDKSNSDLSDQSNSGDDQGDERGDHNDQGDDHTDQDNDHTDQDNDHIDQGNDHVDQNHVDSSIYEASDDDTVVEVGDDAGKVTMITVKESAHSQSGGSENEWDDALLHHTSSDCSPATQERRAKRKGKGNVSDCFKALLSPSNHYRNKRQQKAKNNELIGDDYGIRGCGYKKQRGGRGVRGRGRGFHHLKHEQQQQS